MEKTELDLLIEEQDKIMEDLEKSKAEVEQIIKHADEVIADADRQMRELAIIGLMYATTREQVEAWLEVLPK